MNILMTPSIDNNLPLKAPIFVFVKLHRCINIPHRASPKTRGHERGSRSSWSIVDHAFCF